MLANRIERNFKKKNKVNIIPLIDIIFLMLVFFMLATNFEINDHVDITINNSGNSDKNEPKVLTIILKNNGGYKIDKKEISQSQIKFEIKSIWVNNKYEEVFILNQKNAIVQDLIFLMDILKSNKIDKIFFNDLDD
tara:strand:+ start:87 stop:494 length:408 start_codon:yes stop_codon:yes gene_type:complete